jgi:hypothetical protein
MCNTMFAPTMLWYLRKGRGSLIVWGSTRKGEANEYP